MNDYNKSRFEEFASYVPLDGRIYQWVNGLIEKAERVGGLLLENGELKAEVEDMAREINQLEGQYLEVKTTLDRHVKVCERVWTQ